MTSQRILPSGTSYIVGHWVFPSPDTVSHSRVAFSRMTLLLSQHGIPTVSCGSPSPGSNLEKRDDNLPARIPYVFPPPGTDPIADTIRARRTNGTLLDLDGVLLNAPLIAQGEDDLFGVIRDNNTLPPAMRELFILRIAVLNNASYEWLQHESVGRMAGLTTEQLLAIRLAPPFFASQGVNLTSILGADLVAAMTFTDWITKNVHVPDDVFNALKTFLNDSQLVEATATAAGYSFISRFVVALNVDAKMDATQTPDFTELLLDLMDGSPHFYQPHNDCSCSGGASPCLTHNEKCRHGQLPSSQSLFNVSSSRERSITIVLTPHTIIMTFLALSLAASLAYLSLPSKPLPAAALNNGVGKLPFMGYNTWNAYHCDIDEDVIIQTAQLMKSLGLADLGYEHMNIDDCWAEKTRSASGDLVANATRFPSGFNNLTSQIHDLGLKAGIYSDSGWFTCQLYPGSYLNEARDAEQFQNWGFDLLKYDNCAVPFDEIIDLGMVGKYTRMADAIANLSATTGQPPLLYSLCQWGREQPWLWARKLGQSWRTTDDIDADWDHLASIINQNSFITWASDFYGHNDMDILEVGNGNLTFDEAKSHYTAWSLMKSPLLIGTDLTTVTNETLEVLTNKEIIAINQDPVVGTSISPFRWGVNPDWTFNATHPAQYWSGESQNGTIFMLLNVLDDSADMFFNLTESPWINAGRQYAVRDLWTHTDNGTAVRNFTAKAVPAHGVVALLMQDAGPEPAGTQPPCARPEWCIDQNGTLVQ